MSNLLVTMPGFDTAPAGYCQNVTDTILIKVALCRYFKPKMYFC